MIVIQSHFTMNRMFLEFIMSGDSSYPPVTLLTLPNRLQLSLSPLVKRTYLSFQPLAIAQSLKVIKKLSNCY